MQSVDQNRVREEDIAAKKENKNLAAIREAVFRGIRENAGLCADLAALIKRGDYPGCSEQIIKVYGNDLFKGRHGVQVIRDLLTWAGMRKNRPTNGPHIELVLKARNHNTTNLRTKRRRLINQAGLNPSAGNKTQFYSTIPVHNVRPLKTPFPPPNLYVCENDAIYDSNMEFVLERSLPDGRNWRRLIFELGDPNQLSFDIGPTESAVFEDGDGIVAVVLRDACKRNSVVNFMDKTIKKVVDTRNDIRMEDGGHLSQMGLSAGSRSHSSLGWVRNVVRKKKNLPLHDQINCEASSAFAILWGMLRTLMPGVIVADFENFMESIGPKFRMDGNGKMARTGDGYGTYYIKFDGNQEFEFKKAQLAPPTGVVGENYCRYIHKEKQPHKWAVSLTTSRTFGADVPPTEAGGNFFIASHGIRIQSAANTLIAWRPTDWHGTSLLRVNPFKPADEFHQRGLSFVTGNRLFNAIQKYKSLNMISTDLVHSETEDEDAKNLDGYVAGLRRSRRLMEKELIRSAIKEYRGRFNKK